MGNGLQDGSMGCCRYGVCVPDQGYLVGILDDPACVDGRMKGYCVDTLGDILANGTIVAAASDSNDGLRVQAGDVLLELIGR